MGTSTKNETLIAAVTAVAEPLLRAAYQIKEKQARTEQLKAASAAVFLLWQSKLPLVLMRRTLQKLATSCSNSESKIVRSQILEGEPRIDGRDTRTVRPISIRTLSCHALTVLLCFTW